MQEMAESGAKVLNAQAVDWARRHKVLIHARKTGDFADRGGGRETRVDAATSLELAAIVHDKKLAWVNAPLAARERVLGAVELAGVPIRDAWFDDRVSLLLSLTSVPDFTR